MRFIPQPLTEVVCIEPEVFEDARGFFMETWHAGGFTQAGIAATFVQDNHTGSRRWVLRGLHYQLHQPQGKLVRVISGEVFDVALDLRRSAASFGKWTAQRLSSANRRMLWIPPGFAHGFLVLSEWAEVVYKCTELYAPADERAVRWNDPQLAIDWPIPAGVVPTVSQRDQQAPLLVDAASFP